MFIEPRLIGARFWGQNRTRQRLCPQAIAIYWTESRWGILYTVPSLIPLRPGLTSCWSQTSPVAGSVCWVDSNLKLLISKPPGWDEVPCSGSLSGNHDSISATGMHFMGYVWIAFQSGDGGKADYPELSHSILFGQILLQDRLSRLCVLLWNP